VKVYKISAITLSIKNMEKSCKFYSRIPGFKVVYGGSNDDTFTTFKIDEDITMYLNLELRTNNNNITTTHVDNRSVRIIFHTEDVDGLYSRFKNDVSLSELISFENEPMHALWGERFFHIRDLDGYQLSFATPISRKSNQGLMG
jgi:catechol 2,3-dioxygenase-like lactoylglutathione lyase family enzyme